MTKIWNPYCPRCDRHYKPLRFPDDEVICIGHPQCPQCLAVLWIVYEDLVDEPTMS